MSPHATRHTRPRCDRLADYAASGPLPTILAFTLLLALFHPAAPLAGLLVLCGRRLGRRPTDRSPTVAATAVQ
ncbi:hypothetical protein ACFQL0_07625 [Haloplanus litoreus]|uniref:hypothetical protein n=1 Tax=Haloplanus litoreus TaxID=767515 RepID=UPI003610ACFB